MSTRALAIAFSALALTVIAATAIVGGVFLSDNPQAMQAIRKAGQAPSPQDPPAESINFGEIQRIIDDHDATVRLERIANGGRKEWIESELADRAAFCVDEVAKHYPGRSLAKTTALSVLLMKGMNQNRFGDNPMTSHEMARHILSIQGEEIEIEANRAIEGR